MDNQKHPGQPQDDSWLDEILDSPELSGEIGPDEQAISSAGLTDLNDRELNEIIQEVKAQEYADAPEEQLPSSEPFRDEEYRDIFGDGEELEQLFSDDAPLPEAAPAPREETEETTTEEKPMRKGRPKRKKGYGLLGIPHILATMIWLAIIAVIGVSLGRIVWLCAADVLAFGQEPKTVTITIAEEDDLDSIAGQLHDAGLVKYPELFKLFAELTGKEEKIGVGTFTLNAPDPETGEIPGIVYDYNALVNSLRNTSSGLEEVKVVIPEGYTCAQIFQRLEENGVCTAEELEEYAANGELGDYWFLEGLERGDKYCLEGYMFPDTYQFYVDDEPGRVIAKFLDNFDVRFSDLLKDKMVALNERVAAMMRANGYGQDYIDEHQMTIREVVIVASMIEEETSGTLESYAIGGVIYNRLTNAREYPYLNIDATLIYALEGNLDPETGKTKPLTDADKEMDNPYNTYKYTGLIPGPISNPGLNSLNAALDPDESNYHYYVYDPNAGSHLFAETYDKHLENVAKVENAG